MPGFDPIASRYDQDFTRTLTGALQRQTVMDYLEKHLSGGPLRILELGCGTGVDAICQARKGNDVVATDISGEMIAVAREKLEEEGLSGRLEFQVMDMRQLAGHPFNRPFDVVFSNFGAVNCLDPRETAMLFRSLERVLSDQGRIIMVMMPAFCAWESLYFMVKGRWSSAFRRRSKGKVMANLGGFQVGTWYYSPAKLMKLAGSSYAFVRKRPVGFFLPPSYLDMFFKRNRRWLSFLARMERNVSGLSLLSGVSDHYILEMKKER